MGSEGSWKTTHAVDINSTELNLFLNERIKKVAKDKKVIFQTIISIKVTMMSNEEGLS